MPKPDKRRLVAKTGAKQPNVEDSKKKRDTANKRQEDLRKVITDFANKKPDK